jgi:hypothetical protein
MISSDCGRKGCHTCVEDSCRCIILVVTSSTCFGVGRRAKRNSVLEV